MLRARIAMRLEQHQQAIKFANFGGFQCGANFYRVMAVVVDDGDVVGHAFYIEPAPNSGKFCQTIADQFDRHAQIQSHGRCCGGVAHVVNAWRVRQAKAAKRFAFKSELELADQSFQFYIADYQVGLAGRAVRNNGALDVRHDGLHVDFVKTQYGRAIKWHALHKLNESVLNVFQRSVLIEVLAVDGGDHRDDRRKQEKAAVALVRFHHEVIPFAQLRGGPRLIYAAADDEGGIEMRCGQNRSDHGGGGGFSVGSGDGDAIFQAHQFGKHLGARNHRDFHFVRFDDFGIAGDDRGRGHHHVRAIDVDSFMRIEDCGAKWGEPLGDSRRLAIGAGDRIAQRQKHFGDAAHADAAYAHQVNALKIPEA